MKLVFLFQSGAAGGDPQIVTMPLTMANAISGQGQTLLTSNNQQQTVTQAPGTTQVCH